MKKENTTSTNTIAIDRIVTAVAGKLPKDSVKVASKTSNKGTFLKDGSRRVFETYYKAKTNKFDVCMRTDLFEAVKPALTKTVLETAVHHEDWTMKELFTLTTEEEITAFTTKMVEVLKTRQAEKKAAEQAEKKAAEKKAKENAKKEPKKEEAKKSAPKKGESNKK